MYFDDNNFHILFYKQSFMEINKINCSLQIKENFFEESNDYITYFMKIEGDIQKIDKYYNKSSFYQTFLRDTEFILNDINKYNHFVITVRFQHSSNNIINDKADPDIKEIDKKLIEIKYPLINSMNEIVNFEMNDIEEENSNNALSNSEESD